MKTAIYSILGVTLVLAGELTGEALGRDAILAGLIFLGCGVVEALAEKYEKRP